MTTQTAFDWEKFFATARGWIFQAAPCNPGDEGRLSLGGMETIYQAFKARMEAEREQEKASGLIAEGTCQSSLKQ